MPTYPLTFPTGVYLDEVQVRRRWAGARFDNPVDLTNQTQLRSAKRYELDLRLQPMARAAAVASGMAQFLDDLQGSYGWFAFDLSPWCPGLSPAPGVLNFQLATQEHGWSIGVAEVGFSFTVIQKL